jgi:hypothetical protein
METDAVYETLCSLVFRIPDDGQSLNPIILSAIHHCQNLLKSTRFTSLQISEHEQIAVVLIISTVST